LPLVHNFSGRKIGRRKVKPEPPLEGKLAAGSLSILLYQLIYAFIYALSPLLAGFFVAWFKYVNF
jgi:hypothetical protein